MEGLTPGDREQFQTVILGYYRRHLRRLPWRETSDPYRILVSEIMLQQTQVVRVLPKYDTFLDAFPTVAVLSRAPLAEVLRLWQGLGYNRRAKYLKTCAEKVVLDFDGRFPTDRATLRSLPGIGDYTSGAICAFAYRQSVAFMDTNIRRVYIHFFFPDADGVRDDAILPLISETIFTPDPRSWYYALMDYGAMLAKAFPNANRRSAHYTRPSAFENSNRQIRGQILRRLATGRRPLSQLIRELDFDEQRIAESIAGLAKDELIVRDGNVVYLPGD